MNVMTTNKIVEMINKVTYGERKSSCRLKYLNKREP